MIDGEGKRCICSRTDSNGSHLPLCAQRLRQSGHALLSASVRSCFALGVSPVMVAPPRGFDTTSIHPSALLAIASCTVVTALRSSFILADIIVGLSSLSSRNSECEVALESASLKQKPRSTRRLDPIRTSANSTSTSASYPPPTLPSYRHPLPNPIANHSHHSQPSIHIQPPARPPAQPIVSTPRATPTLAPQAPSHPHS